MANKIQLRRGLKTNLPTLDIGEPAFCTDTKELYVGSASGNVKMSYDTSQGVIADDSDKLGGQLPAYYAKQADIDAHKIDYTLQIPYGGTTTNSGNNYSIASPTITALNVGMAISLKINADSTDASTLNWNGKGAKPIKKPNGNNVTNLKAGGIYTFRYNGTNFILQGEGGEYGTATQADVLNTVTFGTEQGSKQGTMDLSNLTPGNVRENVNINGVVGTVPGPGSIINPDKLSAISVSLPKNIDIIDNSRDDIPWFIRINYANEFNALKIYGTKLFATIYDDFSVIVFDLKTGDQLTKCIINSEGQICNNLSYFNGSILLGGNRGSIYRIDGNSIIFTTAVWGADQAWTDIDSLGNIFTIHFDSGNPHLCKYSYNDGTLLWKYTGITASAQYIRMCVVNRTNHYVYIHDNSSPSTIYIIDSDTGNLRSHVSESYFSGEIYWSEKDNSVYVITNSIVYKLDPTLTNVLWSTTTAGASGLKIGSNGNIIIAQDSTHTSFIRADTGSIIDSYIHSSGIGSIACIDDNPNPLCISTYSNQLWFNTSIVPTQYKLN